MFSTVVAFGFKCKNCFKILLWGRGKGGEGRTYYLQQIRGTPGHLFPKPCLPELAKLGTFETTGTCVFLRGLE